jgi:predicted aldo/keto reductase-like oxidoreductase
MPDYIVCQKKRNNPRMDVRICERRCPQKVECKEYLTHHRVGPQDAQPSLQADAPPLELEAA